MGKSKKEIDDDATKLNVQKGRHQWKNEKDKQQSKICPQPWVGEWWAARHVRWKQSINWWRLWEIILVLLGRGGSQRGA